MFLLLHSFVNIFAGGRSDVKVILFPIFVLCLFLSVLLFKKSKTTPVYLFVVPLSCLYLLGVLLHLVSITRYNLSLGTFFITGNNNEVSSSVIDHIHEAKVFGAGLVELGGNIVFNAMDAGGAYLGLFPKPVVFFGSLLLVIVGLSAVFLINRFYSTSSSTRVGRVLFIFWYGIVAFALVKSAIDGGFLSPLVPTVLLAIAFFLTIRKDLASKASMLSIIPILFCCLMSVIAPGLFSSIVLMQSLATFCLLAFLALCINKRSKMFILCFFILFLMTWWLASVRDRALYSYGATEIGVNEEYYVFNRQNGFVEKKISENNTTIRKIAKQKQANLSYGPISVPGKTCFSHGHPDTSYKTILTKKQFKTIITTDMSIAKVQEVFDGLWWRADVRITTAPCLPEPLSVFDAEMRRHGFDVYVMVEK